jgi:cytoskeletal protein RodZ
MDKYLIDFLKENSTLILPGIGALTITNAETGEILFMPFLKHDNGRLAEFIASKEGIDEQQARIQVAQYTREIERKLNTEGTYDIYLFGQFTREADGSFNFAGLKDVKEPVLPESSPSKEEEKKEPILEDVVLPVIEEHLIPEEIEEAPITINNEPVLDEISEPTYTEEEQWNDDLDLPPINHKPEPQKKAILEKVNPDKKKRKPIFIAALSIVVIGIGVLLTYSLFYNTLEPVVKQPKLSKNKVVAPEKSTSDKEPETAESKPEEITASEEEQTNEIPSTNVDQVNSEGPYHVVIGAFRVKENADRYTNKQQANGKTTVSIHEMYGLYLIHLDDFTSRSDAEDACTNLRAEYPGAWVYYQP